MATTTSTGLHGSSKIVVIKIGTSSLINEVKDQMKVNLKQIAAITETCLMLHSLGHKIVLVTSGAVGLGRHELNILRAHANIPAISSTDGNSHANANATSHSPLIIGSSPTLAERQALAAIGQVKLMAQYQMFFSALHMSCAQILITYETFKLREQYQNAEATFRTLLQMGIVPVVNENDTVATEELRSENDTMAAMVASMIGADFLFLMTDVDGLFTANPKKDPTAKKIQVVESPQHLEQLAVGVGDAVGGSAWGTGGMNVKLNAAMLAASLGIQCTIMCAKDVERISQFVEKQSSLNPNDLNVNHGQFDLGTTFLRVRKAPSKRKRWIRGLRCAGTIELDAGAVKAVQARKDIYTVGISKVVGNFSYMSTVKIVDQRGKELGRGLSNLSSEDIRAVRGLNSDEIEKLGIRCTGVAFYRKNIAVDSPRSVVQEAEKDAKKLTIRKRPNSILAPLSEREDEDSDEE